MTDLKKVLMERENLSSEEADDIISEMAERIAEGENPEEVLHDEGLEPDYVFDLI